MAVLSDILPTGFECGVLNGQVKPGDTERALKVILQGDANMLFLIADGKVVCANRRGEEVLGIDREEGTSRGFDVFRMVAVAPEYLGLCQESFRQRLRGEEVLPAACALLTRDGRRIEGVLTSALVESQGRRELLGIFTDKKPARFLTGPGRSATMRPEVWVAHP
jgi:PAS domain S-box-containing protein